jgi:hypothetical protein
MDGGDLLVLLLDTRLFASPASLDGGTHSTHSTASHQQAMLEQVGCG